MLPAKSITLTVVLCRRLAVGGGCGGDVRDAEEREREAIKKAQWIQRLGQGDAGISA